MHETTQRLRDICAAGIKFLQSLPVEETAPQGQNRRAFREMLDDALSTADNQADKQEDERVTGIVEILSRLALHEKRLDDFQKQLNTLRMDLATSSCTDSFVKARIIERLAELESVAR